LKVPAEPVVSIVVDNSKKRCSSPTNEEQCSRSGPLGQASTAGASSLRRPVVHVTPQKRLSRAPRKDVENDNSDNECVVIVKAVVTPQKQVNSASRNGNEDSNSDDDSVVLQNTLQKSRTDNEDSDSDDDSVVLEHSGSKKVSNEGDAAEGELKGGGGNLISSLYRRNKGGGGSNIPKMNVYITDPVCVAGVYRVFLAVVMTNGLSDRNVYWCFKGKIVAALILNMILNGKQDLRLLKDVQAYPLRASTGNPQNKTAQTKKRPGGQSTYDENIFGCTVLIPKVSAINKTGAMTIVTKVVTSLERTLKAPSFIQQYSQMSEGLARVARGVTESALLMEAEAHGGKLRINDGLTKSLLKDAKFSSSLKNMPVTIMTAQALDVVLTDNDIVAVVDTMFHDMRNVACNEKVKKLVFSTGPSDNMKSLFPDLFD